AQPEPAIDHNPYADPRRVRAALTSLGLRPSKGMGQNFLIDAEPLEQMLAAAQIGPADLVIEVGPGLGILTWELLRSAGRVVSIELDHRLAERLADELAGTANFQLIQADILEITPAQ